ncbi:MAG: hypothetical protein ACR2QK_18870 [Acidimicrobiales bacterium]
MTTSIDTNRRQRPPASAGRTRAGTAGRRMGRWFAAPVLAMLLLAACSEEGQQQVSDALENVSTTVGDGGGDSGGDGGGEAQPEPTAPPATEAPAQPEPTAPVGEAPAEGTTESDLSSSDWILLILLGIAAVALIAAAVSAAGRHSASKSARKNAVANRLGDIIGSARWIHDSGSMEVLLVQDPNQIQSAWAPVRTRMMDVESQISTLAANTRDGDLQRSLHGLGQAVTSLRSAEEGYVTTMTRSRGAEQELLRSNHQSVIDRRRDLQMAIDPVAMEMSTR